MTALATDDFNRANNTDLGVNWTLTPFLGAGFSIVSNAAVATSLAGDAGEYYSGTSFPDDQYAQAAVTAVGASGGTGHGVSVRASSSADDYYRIVVSAAASAQVDISSLVASGVTSITTRTQAWSAGDVLRVEMQGSTMRVYRNGVQMGASITDTTLTTGFAGVCYSSTASAGSLVDNWEGGDFTAGAATSDVQTTQAYPLHHMIVR